MADNFFKIRRGLNLEPTTTNPSEKGDVVVDSVTGALEWHDGSSVRTPSTTDGTETLTNKTIDADNNTITNIDNNEIKASAAIDRSKLASGTNYRIVANNGSGVMSENAALTADHVVIADANGQLSGEATLAVSRGGTNTASYTAGDLLYATGATTLTKLAIGTSGTVLKSTGSAPAWQSNTQTLTYLTRANANTGYTILSTDDVIVWTLTDGNNNTTTLPSAASNAGKIYRIKLTNTTASFNTLTVNRDGSDTFILMDGTTGATSLLLYTAGETYTIISDGTSAWQVIDHQTTTPWTAYTLTIGGATPPTEGSGATKSSWWKRSGDDCFIRFEYGQVNAGADGSGTYLFPIPSGIVIDNTKMTPATDGYSSPCGQGSLNGNGTFRDCLVKAYDTTNLVLITENSGTTLNSVGSGQNPLGTGNTYYYFLAQIPISGWKV